MEHESTYPRIYYRVYIVLMALLAVTVAASLLPHGPWTLPIAMIIATAKAVLVILYFMHVRDSSRLTWVFVAAGFLWLGILFVLTLSDYISRGWLRDTIERIGYNG